MIPLYRTSNMERSVNLLAKHYRQVFVCGATSNLVKIRFRADLITVPVRFGKVKSQIVLWQNSGGVLISWKKNWDLSVGSHEAIFFPECPRDIDMLDRQCQEASDIAVIYRPPTWRLHHETLEHMVLHKPEREKRAARDRLERVKSLVEAAPWLTPLSLDRLLRARQQARVPPLSVPVSREVVARASDIRPVAP